MSNDKKPQNGQDSATEDVLDQQHEQNNSTKDDFVMPEPDGVHSGVPFESSGDFMQDAIENDAVQRNSRMESEDGSRAFQGGFMNSRSKGVSLRIKLNLGVGVLIAVIALIGLVSLSALNSVNSISDIVANDQARLAKVTEEIKATVYKMRDAEKDFMLLEEQESLDRVTRFTAKVRTQLDKAAEIDGRISERTGVKISDRYDGMNDKVDEYESRFSTQVKNIRLARDTLRNEDDANQKNKEDLASRIDGGIESIRQLSTDYWLTTAASVDRALLQTGLDLEQIEKDLLEVRIMIANFFGTGNQAFADHARNRVAEVLADMDKLRNTTGDEYIRAGMTELRKTMQLYLALIKDSSESIDNAEKKREMVDTRITQQKEGLRDVGASVIGLAENLSKNSWDEIAKESGRLTATSDSAQWQLGVMVFIGVIVGLLVLILVPRPIINGISSLLNGAKQVAAGNLNFPVIVSSNDEIGELAGNFNHMRENLLALVQRIQRASVQLSTAINEIQAASTQQASASNEQASAVNELSASLTQMAQAATTLVSSSETVTRNVDDIAVTVNDNNVKSTQMMESMNGIGVSTRQTADRIKSLNDKMDDINEAVATISLVADQTTLLSLNASIEANKAGEMGKGFSVVANEIRRLSDRSIDSATGISSMVRDIQRATENSTVAMDKSSEEIRQGIDMVKGSTDSMNTINESMDHIQEQMGMILESVRSQAESSSNVQTTANELLSSANMVSQAARQTQKVTYELNAMATQLASAVAVFRT